MNTRPDYVEQIAKRLWQTGEGAPDSSGWEDLGTATKTFWRGYASRPNWSTACLGVRSDQ